MNNLERIKVLVLVVMVSFLLGSGGELETKSMTSPASTTGEKSSTNVVNKTVQVKTVSKDTKNKDMPIYKPPLRGAPSGRIGGGTRGMEERESFSLLVLAPDHVGLTIKDQPCLYWFISKPIQHPVELTIIERKAVMPLVEKIIKGPVKGGIQAIRTSDYGVHLKKDVQYKWFVTIVTDPQHRSKDILAGGIITMVDAPATLQAKLKDVDSSGATYVYAEEGLWYDALGAISEMIDASPNNSDLRKQRASLLEQVGLMEVAAFENIQQ